MQRHATIAAIALAALLSACSSPKQAKYVFLVIGDGFGLAQAVMAETYLDAKAADTATNHLTLLQLPEIGVSTTHSANQLITCSSAAGTALATGHKTNNGMLGVRPDTSALESIAKKLHNQGFNIGIVSSVSLDHATPAAFYANAKSRRDYVDISRQLALSGFEYFGGGALRGVLKDSTVANDIRAAGYTMLNNKELIDSHNLNDGKLIASSSVVLAEAEIPYVIDTPQHDMHLSYFVQKGINLLSSSPKPFFMMIEGGKIDWSCHGNDAATTLHEVLEMDKALGIALQFYREHPDETLIIVTADHETGGLGLGIKGYKIRPDLLDGQRMSEDAFSQQVDAMAQRNASRQELYSTIERSFGFNGPTPFLALNRRDSARIDLIYRVRFAERNRDKSDMLMAYDMHEGETIASLCVKMMSEKAGFGWTSLSHTGVAVPVRAIGAGAERFGGCYDNTDIPRKI
ncbi:MAG: alkaline phosphatase, partial [Bacteroidales bacterium]|nr:alkaline phosphatase [Bacteroidales bacterium]